MSWSVSLVGIFIEETVELGSKMANVLHFQRSLSVDRFKFFVAFIQNCFPRLDVYLVTSGVSISNSRGVGDYLLALGCNLFIPSLFFEQIFGREMHDAWYAADMSCEYTWGLRESKNGLLARSLPHVSQSD